MSVVELPKDELKQRLIERLRILEVIDNRPTVGSSGQVLPLYIKIKKAYGDLQARLLMAEAVWREMSGRVTFVAGMDVGGEPLANTVSILHGIDKYTIIRGKIKEYGTGGRLEGYEPKENDRGYIFDDVITTGKSLVKAWQALAETKAEMAGCIVVVRGTGNGELAKNLNVKHILTFEEILGDRTVRK